MGGAFVEVEGTDEERSALGFIDIGSLSWDPPEHLKDLIWSQGGAEAVDSFRGDTYLALRMCCEILMIGSAQVDGSPEQRTAFIQAFADHLRASPDAFNDVLPSVDPEPVWLRKPDQDSDVIEIAFGRLVDGEPLTEVAQAVGVVPAVVYAWVIEHGDAAMVDRLKNDAPRL